ncbi:MAG: hypothetical protein A2Z04_02525 [Chloroflexi bacterium RBG_16_57_9]|nr:MAG: hypothetical protein A2Z04_02525 [Chloroflexi bacterium RBG_16_57_9]
MVTAEQHRLQAEHNKAFFQSFDLDTSPYLDWVVTATFYSALHLVEWFLKAKGVVSRRDHHLRDAYIARISELRSIYPDYTELKFQSEAARYECARFTPEIVKKDLLPRLARLESHIKTLLSASS